MKLNRLVFFGGFTILETCIAIKTHDKIWMVAIGGATLMLVAAIYMVREIIR